MTSAVSGALSHTAPLWTQLAAGAAAATIAVTGVTVGASRSLPGDLLYGVKRQVEVIQLDLAGSRNDKALANLGFARARLHEISALLNREGSADTALSPELQKRISDLMESWAGATSAGTTTLLGSLRGTPADAARLREALTSFTRDAAQGLAIVVQQLPDATLQSLTGSAFAYLQRVDTALGSPIDLARLLPSLGLDLPSAPAPAPAVRPSTAPSASASPKSGGGSSGSSSAGSGSSTASSGAGSSSSRSSNGSSAGSPSSVPTLPIPGSGGTSVQIPSGGSSTPKVPSLPRRPLGNTTGRLGNTSAGAAGAATDTVNGVLQGVTGKGPGLRLPTSVPTPPGASR